MREAREKADLTQRALAAALKRDRSFVWKCEKGERRMDIVDLIRWANACGADPLDILKRIMDAER